MKHIQFLAAAIFAAAGTAQAAPVVELPQDAPRVFIHTAEAGPIVTLPYQGSSAAPVVAAAAAPAVVANLDAAPATSYMVALTDSAAKR